MFWKPFDEIAMFSEEMEKMMNRYFGKNLLSYGKGNEIAKTRMPQGNICETENNIVATFELPGADKNDIELNVTGDSIEVKSEKKIEKKSDNEYSMTSSSFYRKVPLPKKVDSSKSKATYKEGILIIEIPKLKEIDKKNRIQIE